MGLGGGNNQEYEHRPLAGLTMVEHGFDVVAIAFVARLMSCIVIFEFFFCAQPWAVRERPIRDAVGTVLLASLKDFRSPH